MRHKETFRHVHYTGMEPDLRISPLIWFECLEIMWIKYLCLGELQVRQRRYSLTSLISDWSQLLLQYRRFVVVKSERSKAQTLLKNKLTPWNTILLQKLIITQLVKKFPAFMEP